MAATNASFSLALTLTGVQSRTGSSSSTSGQARPDGPIASHAAEVAGDTRQVIVARVDVAVDGRRPAPRRARYVRQIESRILMLHHLPSDGRGQSVERLTTVRPPARRHLGRAPSASRRWTGRRSLTAASRVSLVARHERGFLTSEERHWEGVYPQYISRRQSIDCVGQACRTPSTPRRARGQLAQDCGRQTIWDRETPSGRVTAPDGLAA
jgi:hypothetical protein